MNRFQVSSPALGILILLVGLLVASSPAPARASSPGPTSIPVVFVPGIAGSRLADIQNAEYWTAAGFSGHDLLTLYPSQLHPTLYATSVLTRATFLGIHIPSEDWQTYGPLLAYLGTQGFVPYDAGQDPSRLTSAGCDLSQASNNPNLFVFAYDWRKSNVESAALLADYIKCVQKFYPDTDVNILAHSMGGLVARRYIIQNTGTHSVNALVSVASPYAGATQLVWVEETGNFVFFVWASTILNIIGSFNGASELMNSDAWYQLGGVPALVENGQDLNGNGKYDDKFTYPMLVEYMDNAKGEEGFFPGTANLDFHSYTIDGNNQDDWRNDTTGVKYFHIVGAGLVPDTVNQVVAGTLWKCLQNFSICNLATWMYPKYAQGDGTVPLLSTTRMGPSADFNAPGATLYTCEAFGANQQNVNHIGMLSNPMVQNLLLEYLTQANGGSQAAPPPSLQCGVGQAVAPTGNESKYHQVRISGATDVRVSDGTTGNFPDTVSQFDDGDNGSTLLLASGKTYEIQFHATAEPLYFEWSYRDADGPRRIVRHLDAVLAPDALAQFKLKDGKMSKLRYDSDGDGIVDKRVKRTADLKGEAARDTRAPKVRHKIEELPGGKLLITLGATDAGTGVANVFYSFDKHHFSKYTGPFDAVTVYDIFVFADDKAGNRSRLVTIELE